MARFHITFEDLLSTILGMKHEITYDKIVLFKTHESDSDESTFRNALHELASRTQQLVNKKLVESR
jgi:Mn-dependent DtxR family transcriptional regulator